MAREVPRIPPRAAQDWDDTAREALASVRPPTATGPVPNMLGIFAWHPVLSRSWLTFSGHLRRSTLPDRVRELATMRTSWLRRGEYEWAQHVRMSREAGLTDEEIAAIRVGPAAEVGAAGAWPARDRAVLRAVDEMIGDRYVGDETWSELGSFLSREQLMDLVFTVGAYDMHCMAFNTFGLELEPGMEGFAAPVPSALQADRIHRPGLDRAARIMRGDGTQRRAA
jgi:alkylhydroperoxidase family enzyme